MGSSCTKTWINRLGKNAKRKDGLELLFLMQKEVRHHDSVFNVKVTHGNELDI